MKMNGIRDLEGLAGVIPLRPSPTYPHIHTLLCKKHFMGWGQRIRYWDVLLRPPRIIPST